MSWPGAVRISRPALPVLFSAVALVLNPVSAYPQGQAGFKQRNLVSDVAGLAVKRDRNLVNPWGMAASPTGPIWIANEESGVSTVYDSHGKAVRDGQRKIVVAIPGAAGDRSSGKPTGIVFNGTQDFTVTLNGVSGPATFIFVSLDGLITGWNSTVSPDTAVILIDNSGTGAAYTGVTLVTTTTGSFLVLANFAQGTVDVYDSNLALVTRMSDPDLPEGFAPFNVRNINGMIFVAFAKRGEDGEDEPGPGLGFVDIFDLNGTMLRRFASQGTLNAPWGMAVAPIGFGEFGGNLLVGNFGDGRINVFDINSGELVGQLKDRRGREIEIEGLWDLLFGNGGGAGRTTTLFFTAGLDDEEHGLFGSITFKNSGR
jgi:uncharacterized protein (TIGR03118 family)